MLLDTALLLQPGREAWLRYSQCVSTSQDGLQLIETHVNLVPMEVVMNLPFRTVDLRMRLLNLSRRHFSRLLCEDCALNFSGLCRAGEAKPHPLRLVVQALAACERKRSRVTKKFAGVELLACEVSTLETASPGMCLSWKSQGLVVVAVSAGGAL